MLWARKPAEGLRCIKKNKRKEKEKEKKRKIILIEAQMLWARKIRPGSPLYVCILNTQYYIFII